MDERERQSEASRRMKTARLEFQGPRAEHTAARLCSATALPCIAVCADCCGPHSSHAAEAKHLPEARALRVQRADVVRGALGEPDGVAKVARATHTAEHDCKASSEPLHDTPPCDLWEQIPCTRSSCQRSRVECGSRTTCMSVASSSGARALAGYKLSAQLAAMMLVPNTSCARQRNPTHEARSSCPRSL